MTIATGTIEVVLRRLDAAMERAKLSARDAAPDLAKEIDRWVIFISAQMRGYEAQLVATDLKTAERAYLELAEAVAEVREVITTRQAEAQRAVEVGRPGLASVVDVERLEAAEEEARAARADVGQLMVLLAKGERLLPPVADAVGRTAQGAVIALRRLAVERARARRATLGDQLNVSRAAAEDLGEAAEVLARMVQRLGRPLPVPAIRWHGADHVAEVELVEPEIPEPSERRAPA